MGQFLLMENIIQLDKVTKKFAELNTHTYGEFFKKLSPELREKLPAYIKENIDINRFIDA